ncbi:MAG: hypothetical protein LBF94_03400 [Puniceicoccales bacterium]|nr:hypothetical protein [Puniceicoccales bacterium]
MKFVAEINTMFAFHKESEVDGEEPRDVAYERNSGNVAAEAKPEEVVKGEIPELNDKENTNLKILRESMAALIEKPGTEEPMKLHVALKGSVCSFKAIREAEREVIAENTGLAMENPGSAEEGVPLVGVIDGAVLPGETKVAPMLAREEADIPPTGKFPVVETFIEEAA